MQILVVGAGQVGSAVARDLSKSHEIVIIDHNAERLERLRYNADVMTFEGNGADIEALKEAGADKADIVIASTDDDRVNILVCGTARALNSELFTVARVTNTGYLKSWTYSREAFGVDLMLGSDYLTAKAIVQVVYEQMAQAVTYFDQGRVEMAEFRLPKDCPLSGKPIHEVDIFEGIRYAAVVDGDDFEVARGDTIMPEEGRVVVIGRTEDVHEFGRYLCADEQERVRRLFVLGGGEIGYQTAKLLEQRGLRPKVIEPDTKRAEKLAQELPKSFVLCDDPLDPDALTNEGLSRAQVVIAALDNDEANLFAALQATHLGAERVLAVVHEKKYQPLFDRFDIEVTFNPRSKVIEEIIRHTRSRRLEKVAFVEQHQGEVIEIKLSDESPLAAKTIEEVAPHFPESVVIGAISRSGRVIIPRGDTVLEVGDDLIIFATADAIDEVLEKL